MHPFFLDTFHIHLFLLSYCQHSHTGPKLNQCSVVKLPEQKRLCRKLPGPLFLFASSVSIFVLLLRFDKAFNDLLCTSIDDYLSMDSTIVHHFLGLALHKFYRSQWRVFCPIVTQVPRLKGPFPALNSPIWFLPKYSHITFFLSRWCSTFPYWISSASTLSISFCWWILPTLLTVL